MSSPTVTRHAPGVAQIEVPLPFERLRFVNAYVLEGDEGLTLVDAGTATEAGYRAIADGLATLGHGLGDVRRLIGTHFHPDHVGLAQTMVERLGLDFVMHAAAPGRVVEYNDWTISRNRLAALARCHGATQAEVDALQPSEPRPDWAGVGIPPTVTVEDGDKLPLTSGRWLEVIYTPGHDIAHICLRDSRSGLVFSGDHVLPRITPLVMVGNEGEDTLADYLESLQRIVDLHARVTLPAHGPVIERGAERAHQIILHHRRRLDEVIDAVAAGVTTAWAIMKRLFRPNLDPFQQRLAFGETLAHAVHLVNTGELAQDDTGDTVHFRLPR